MYHNAEVKTNKRGHTDGVWSNAGDRFKTCLTHNGESGTTLDLVADVLILNHNASLGRVAGASAAVDEEAGATAHRVGGIGVQIVAVVHALEGAHVAQSVATLGEGAHIHLALAGRVVAARAGGA